MKNIPFEEIVKLGKIISDQPAEINNSKGHDFSHINLSIKMNVGSIEGFCKLHGLVFQKIEHTFPDSKEQKSDENIDYYYVGRLESEGSKEAVLLGMLAFEKNTANVTDLYTTLKPENEASKKRETLFNKVFLSYQAEILNNPAFVEKLLKRNISDEEKQKVLFAKILTSEIDKKFDKTKENIIHLGEAHYLNSYNFYELVIKNYLEDKYNVKKVCTENFISTSTRINKEKEVNVLLGIEIGKEIYEEYYNSGDFSKRDNIKFIDKKTKNPLSEAGCNEREEYMIENILEFSKGSNALVITGSMHMIIDEKLKNSGKNLIMFAPLTVESKDGEKHFQERANYTSENSFMMSYIFPIPLFKKMNKMNYEEIKSQVDKTLNLLTEINSEINKEQKQKNNSIKR
jgi:hypothetical protein